MNSVIIIVIIINNSVNLNILRCFKYFYHMDDILIFVQFFLPYKVFQFQEL